MKTPRARAIVLLAMAYFLPGSAAATEVVAMRVDQAPAIDGNGQDAAWAKAGSVTVNDAVANIPLTLKTVYTGDNIYWLVSFPDDAPNREHKTQHWNQDAGYYVTGPEREDTFIFKWALFGTAENLTVPAERSYQADIWFWKAVRTDPVGYADDKLQVYSSNRLPKSKRVLSTRGRPFYLTRSGDQGTAAYQVALYPAYEGDHLPKYTVSEPSGSRADVRAKGQWHNGRWTIEFARKLTTGHVDDVQFETDKTYTFGVSRFEIAARPINPNIEEPRFGAGEIGELLSLRFQSGD